MASLNINNPWIVLIALAVNLIIGLIALKSKMVDKSGFYTGVLIGIVVFISFQWQGFLLLFLFFMIGSVATKFKAAEKARIGAAQKKEGQRSAKNVIANGVVPFLIACAFLVSTTPTQDQAQLYFAAFVAAIASALGDTLSTELGQVYGKKTFLLISMERVKPGTDGGVSTEGTLIGVAGSLILALCAAMLGQFPQYPVKTVVLVTFAAVIANLVESIIGGIFNQFEKSPNEFMLNLTNTAIGAGLLIFFM